VQIFVELTLMLGETVLDWPAMRKRLPSGDDDEH
jgi:hypothetical protein